MKHQEGYIKNLKKLQKRMEVWKNLTEKEEKEYLLRHEWSPYKNAMPVGKRYVVNDNVMFAHHMDDQDG